MDEGVIRFSSWLKDVNETARYVGSSCGNCAQVLTNVSQHTRNFRYSFKHIWGFNMRCAIAVESDALLFLASFCFFRPIRDISAVSNEVPRGWGQNETEMTSEISQMCHKSSTSCCGMKGKMFIMFCSTLIITGWCLCFGKFYSKLLNSTHQCQS